MRAHLFLAITLVFACDADASREAQDRAAPSPPVTLPPVLDRVLRDYEAAYAKRDAAALSTLFGDDGFLMEMNAPPVRGRPAIMEALQGEGGPIRLVPISYAMSDTVAFVIGTFGAERAANEGGKFVLALRRRPDGAWFIAADIANPNFR